MPSRLAGALEAYQRHLGVHAGVARDLVHRIDEVKAYLADTRVMGRMASFGAAGAGRGGSGGGAGSSPPTPKGGSGGGGGLAAAAARSPASRGSPLTLPPGGGGGGGSAAGRPGSSLSLQSHSHLLGPGRASAGGLYALDEDGGGSGGGGMGSTVSSAGASTIPALSPGHRLPHLNTLAPNGGARSGRASLHEYED
ncbi:hypothetical protein CHLRE_17g740187v5 [Chlamydomonas reinhardtii]|uniref:Uncharacterized protein n=1 Tax=Chlamydomonas reinhardtii TaxID=3055 RepID=A0A2K3CRP3_CHLRE|nr:uncharacterized protein CHLRE_17g740187v5 [Chlamydomonas reinhardtii]PNW70949.1 hypothetical protein CHLRE_17g740187v5 [Chlamydomonas reinhardtii]